MVPYAQGAPWESVFAEAGPECSTRITRDDGLVAAAVEQRGESQHLYFPATPILLRIDMEDAERVLHDDDVQSCVPKVWRISKRHRMRR